MGDDMPADASTLVFLRRRGLLAAVFAVAACESDPTPIVQDVAANGESLNLAPTNTLGGARSRWSQRARSRLPTERERSVRIIVFSQPTLTGEYNLDGNGVLAFPLIGNVEASGQTTSQLQQAIASDSTPTTFAIPA